MDRTDIPEVSSDVGHSVSPHLWMQLLDPTRFGPEGRLKHVHVDIVPTAVEGPVERSVVERIVRVSIRRLMECGRMTLQGDNTRSGVIASNLTISPTGVVDRAESHSDDSSLGPSSECVRKTLQSLSFPPGDAGTRASISMKYVTVD
jgi:hypothetical protein